MRSAPAVRERKPAPVWAQMRLQVQMVRVGARPPNTVVLGVEKKIAALALEQPRPAANLTSSRSSDVAVGSLLSARYRAVLFLSLIHI